ncbi:MAG: hypothetical protein K2H80_00160 [Ureaplasma sp.]|nr:hypothetical protein [Ureaplasma sp.]
MENKGKKRVIDQIEYNLRIPAFYKRTWKIIAYVSLLVLALAAVPIIVTKSPTDTSILNALNQNHSLALAAQILSYISFGLIVIPYVFLTACWIVGIDNITKSKYFHMFIWFIYSSSSLLSIIGIIIAFRGYII